MEPASECRAKGKWGNGAIHDSYVYTYPEGLQITQDLNDIGWMIGLDASHLSLVILYLNVKYYFVKYIHQLQSTNEFKAMANENPMVAISQDANWLE